MRDRTIRDLIQAAASRSAADTERLAAQLHGRAGDRHDPVAREWLRRWAPQRVGGLAADCACATGRCAVCN